jgi:hypothetical protein
MFSSQCCGVSGDGEAEAADGIYYSVWKQLIRISLMKHCAMLGKCRLRDCNLNGSQVNLCLILRG